MWSALDKILYILLIQFFFFFFQVTFRAQAVRTRFLGRGASRRYILLYIIYTHIYIVIYEAESARATYATRPVFR